MITTVIVFILLGFLELRFKPRLFVTETDYIIWYGQSSRRNFIKFSKF